MNLNEGLILARDSPEGVGPNLLSDSVIVLDSVASI